MHRFTRRGVVLGLAASFGALGIARIGWSTAPTDRRLVVLFLRGGLDGLAAVPPWGDTDYASARGNAALPAPGQEGGLVDLNGDYGLHPELAPLEALWRKGQLLPIHAVGQSYRGRSHFEAQDILENGTERPFSTEDGWLNRALSVLGGEPTQAVAIGQSLPLMLRGEGIWPNCGRALRTRRVSCLKMFWHRSVQLLQM